MPRIWRFAVAALLLFVTALAGEESAPLRGNTRSHVFHESSCRYYACANCTARFATADEAIQSGYRPCGVCEPRGGRPREKAEAVGAAFVGNTNTHKFHGRSCRYSSCTNCTAKFGSRDEAIAAGYVPGGCCNP